MTDEKPCGEIHPLPCGVDKDCAYLEGYTGNTKLKELIEEWNDNSNLRKPAYECAEELEELIGDDG